MTSTRTWNVLLIEDNPGDANLLLICSRDYPGIEIFNAPNALQANRFLHRTAPFDEVAIPDLVLLDLTLPVFNGFDILQGMREVPDLAHVPVVVLTSSISQADKDRALKLGATDYLIKPVEWGRWQTMVSRIFRRHLKGFVG